MILLLHHIANPVKNGLFSTNFFATGKAAWKLVPKSIENSEEKKYKKFWKITDG